ncbi:ankyrin repeat-containing domain protein [Lasiosphaeria ovina]|uniref:Ankyrin repeat-containing domain protein n=1 Tax=Lasiosphaeria ovina TaxID=92902 RepID=A0AAE0KMQ0_9PEZI|nr:ankyrin repeat-containing domain protein [Lasiosphaeria ovina]
MYHFSDQLNQRVESSQRSIITHVDRRFSFLQSVVVAAIRESIVEELTPLRLQLVPQHAITTTSTSLLQRSVTPPGGMHPCDMVCRCSCHSAGGCFKWRMTAPRPILGSISLTYSRTRVCNDSECRARQMRVSQPRLEIKVAYQFPAWLMRGALSVFFSSNLNGNPELNIRIFNVIQSDPVTAYSTIFGYIDRGDVHGTRRLLEERRGSVYDVLGHGGSSPLFFAVRRRNLNKEIIRLLLQAGADPNQEAPNGLTPTSATLLYYLAGRRGGDELVELLPPYSLLESESCLHMAIAGILQVDLGQALQKPQYLAEINSMSKLMNGRSPLCLAAMRGNLSAVKLLLRAGADVNLKVIKAGTTALHEACSSGRHEVVKVLLEAGALVNERTSNGLTPITVAARVSEGARIISLLIRHGANVQAGPLQVAAATGNTAAVDILLGSGADINHRDWEGDTALFEAIIGRQHGTADLLLLKGIDYTNVNDNGRGLLHVLAGVGDMEMIRAFTDKKLRNLNTAAKDRTGKTPLQLLNERDPTPALRKAFDELLDSVELANEEKPQPGQPETQDDDEDDDSEPEGAFVDAKETLER